MHPLKVAFDALVKQLDKIYGVAHTHDFQAQLDDLEAEINIATEVPAVEENPVKE